VLSEQIYPTSEVYWGLISWDALLVSLFYLELMIARNQIFFPFSALTRMAQYFYQLYGIGLNMRKSRINSLQKHASGAWLFKHEVQGIEQISLLNIFLSFADVAVGSFKSGHAVVLRSHPVITFKPALNTSTRSVHHRMFNFFCTACLTYTGLHVPDTVGKSLFCYKQCVGMCEKGE